MALHLITGYAGREHITSADQGAYNIATFGAGNFVLDRGQKFSANILTNNSISIADGEAMMQGRYIKMPSGTTENVTIQNGTNGKFRNDLICIRYEKNPSNATESTSFVVIKGTESTGTPTDPSYNNGNITDGDATITDFPLYRVKLNGINIDSIEPLFQIKISMVKYMDDYQLPVASSDTLGGVKVGNRLTISNGTLNTMSYSVGDSKTPVYFSGGVPQKGKGIFSQNIRINKDTDSFYTSQNVAAQDVGYFKILENDIITELSRYYSGEKEILALIAEEMFLGDSSGSSSVFIGNASMDYMNTERGKAYFAYAYNHLQSARIFRGARLTVIFRM